MRITDSTIYFTDNGAALCGAHLGATARMTGCDLSGQPIEPITPDLAREFEEITGQVPCCETCGRAASRLVTVEG